MSDVIRYSNRWSEVITLTDILWAIWFVYCTLRYVLAANVSGSLYPYFFIFVCYAIARFFRLHSSILFWGILIIGSSQSILAICQNTGWATSNHPLFDVTGSFDNPGQLGGFLAISIICSLCVGRQGQTRNVWFALFPLLLIQGFALFLSDSRSGWLAVLGGALFLLWPLLATFRKSQVVKIVFFAIIAFILLGLYLYKPQSANGRILIWKVTAEMIADKPFWGHGIGGFNREYMQYQATYFEQHPESALQQYADNVAYPYNELLHIWADQGLIGLLLFLGLIASVLIMPAKKQSYKAALIAYLIYALFSYPSYVAGLLALFPILLVAPQNSALSVQVPLIAWRGAGLVLILCAGYYTIASYLSMKRCQDQIYALYFGRPSQISDARVYITNHYKEVLLDPRTADAYAQYAFKNYEPQQALAVLNDVKKIVPTSELYCDLGDLHLALGDSEMAQKCYQQGGNMIPRRVVPQYKLFNLFRDRKDTLSARLIGKKILSMPVKIEGTRSLRIKADIKHYLESN